MINKMDPHSYGTFRVWRILVVMTPSVTGAISFKYH